MRLDDVITCERYGTSNPEQRRVVVLLQNSEIVQIDAIIKAHTMVHYTM